MEKLKKKTEQTVAGTAITFETFFKKYHFAQVKKYFPYAFYDYRVRENGDDWYLVGLLITGFNKN